MMPDTKCYTTRRAAMQALDRQPVNGFVVNVGEQVINGLTHYYITHPTPRHWILYDRRRPANEHTFMATLPSVVLDFVFPK